jgi:hypothetical protein
MTEGLKALRAHYLDRIKRAEEAALRATDPETAEGWKKVADGYRQLLERLPKPE